MVLAGDKKAQERRKMYKDLNAFKYIFISFYFRIIAVLFGKAGAVLVWCHHAIAQNLIADFSKSNQR